MSSRVPCCRLGALWASEAFPAELGFDGQDPETGWWIPADDPAVDLHASHVLLALAAAGCRPQVIRQTGAYHHLRRLVYALAEAEAES